MSSNLNQLVRLADPAADHDLLGRLPDGDGGAAFAELVRRHGQVVLSICYRILGHPQDAEDAFQATFLILARKSTSVRGQSLGAWLFGVARRVALKLRDKDRRRRRHEASAARPEAATPEPDRGEWLTVLDKEVERLPERYRSAVVACLLGGRTQEEAARELGWSFSTLRRRLERGRELLRARLSGRGLASVGLVFTGTTVVPRALAEATGRKVKEFLNGDRGSAPAVLAQGVLSMMARAKMIKAAMAVLAIGGLVGVWQGVPGGGSPAAAAQQDRPKGATTAETKTAQPDDKIKPGDHVYLKATNDFEDAPLDGLWVVEPGGTIALGPRYGGRVKIGGLTMEEAEGVVQKHVRKFARKAEITMTPRLDAPGVKLERRVQLLEQEVLELRAAIRELQRNVGGAGGRGPLGAPAKR